MARMSTTRGRAFCAFLVCHLLPCFLCGCHRGLHPGPVSYPSPSAVVCPPVTLTGAVGPAGEKAGKEVGPAWPVEAQPIDLPTALRLANVQNPDIAVARERIREAQSRQDLAEMLWLPNLELGPVWMRHDGQIQRSTGEVFTTSRSAAFVGGGPALSVSLADALFAPLAARQVTAARQAGAQGVANEQLLNVALAYVDLLEAYAELPINYETEGNARHLLKFTESYEKAGKGAKADTARSLTEVYRRQREGLEIHGRIALASTRLVQAVRLPPEIRLEPVEPAVMPIALVPENLPLADLLARAFAARPELAENRALIGAVLEDWRTAKLTPWIPTLRLAYAAGGFGGGINESFSDFNGRSDFTAVAVWQLQNFGLGNQALTRERRSQYAQATFHQASLEARIAAQVVSAFSVAYARRQELAASQREVAAARESYRLNEDRIRNAPALGRPIELLQAIQSLAQARLDYLKVVTDYNRAQFRLYTALGSPPLCALEGAAVVPISEPTTPPRPDQPPPPRLLPPSAR